MAKRSDADVKRVLREDGVDFSITERGNEYENKNTVSWTGLDEKFKDQSWAVRTVYNDRFGGVLIRQYPGEGNRKHYHADADECWVILKGRWEWFIEGEGTKEVGFGDIVLVQKGTWHQIKCIGDEPGIRFAITKPDVEHIYES
jgi:quercetin dioxygenase-like cupin family protein